MQIFSQNILQIAKLLLPLHSFYKNGKIATKVVKKIDIYKKL